MSDYPFKKVPGTPEQLQHRREWVDALRSGEYKQAHGTLKTGSGMCCLGVLCDVSKKGEWRKEQEGGFFYELLDGTRSEVNLCLLHEVLEWAGFDLNTSNLQIPHATQAIVGRSSYEGTITTFTSLNDTLKFTFDQIADVIEERFEVAPKA